MAGFNVFDPSTIKMAINTICSAVTVAVTSATSIIIIIIIIIVRSTYKVHTANQNSANTTMN